MAHRRVAGRVYADWGQNDPWKSTVAPWSLRGHALATVAVPLTWEAVERAASTGEASGLLVLASDAVDRADPWAGFFDVRQRLPA